MTLISVVVGGLRQTWHMNHDIDTETDDAANLGPTLDGPLAEQRDTYVCGRCGDVQYLVDGDATDQLCGCSG